MKFNRYLLNLSILFVIYFLTGKLGLTLGAVSGFATLVWLPTGISLAALFLRGTSLWPAVFAGAFLVNLTTGAPQLTSAGIAAGNTLEALIAVYFLKKFQIRASLSRIRDVLVLIIFGAILSTLVSATIGVASLALTFRLTEGFLSTWVAWWIGDMISNLVVAPLILVWSRPFKFTKQEKLEFTLLLMATGALGLFIFTGLSSLQNFNLPIAYLAFPIIIWSALRFRQIGAFSTTFILSFFAIFGTVYGWGPFSNPDLSLALLSLQSFMAIVAISSSLLGASVSQTKELEKKKDEFIAVASHELKTPVASLNIFSDLLTKKLRLKRDKEGEYYAKKINDQIQKLRLLIAELLDVGKIEEGKMVLNKKKFKLGALVKEITDNFGVSHPGYRITYLTKADFAVLADKERIGQVLTNLILNGIKHSPAKHGKVQVRLTKDGNIAKVSVKDFGTGIKESEKERIFEKFYQSDDGKGQRDFSSGLGLYICSQIVKNHKGQIWVESKQGKGSTFFFTLPLS